MGRAHARAERIDEYLTVPRHGRAELRLVEAAPAPVRSLRPDWLPEDLLAPEEEPLAELPAVALEAPTRTRSSSSRDRAAGEDLADVGASRRTVVVSGRPSDDLRFEAWGKQTRQRPSRTAARLAGRPDRVAGWAVALGIAMAIMAVATGGGQPQPSGEAAAPAPPGLAR